MASGRRLGPRNKSFCRVFGKTLVPLPLGHNIGELNLGARGVGSQRACKSEEERRRVGSSGRCVLVCTVGEGTETCSTCDESWVITSSYPRHPDLVGGFSICFADGFGSVSHKVVGGRHLTVEVGLQQQGRTFVSNDCFVGDKGRIWVVTGYSLTSSTPLLFPRVTNEEQSKHGGEEYVLKTECVDLYFSASGQLRPGRARRNWNCG